jgi:hypothetical protein
VKKFFRGVAFLTASTIFALTLTLAPRAFAARGEAAYSAADLKLMSTFLSNFTELGFTDFDLKTEGSDELLHMGAPDAAPDLIRFGVWHNYMNNYKSRISPCKVKDCEWGSLTIDGKHVAESVKKYFGIDFKPVSVTESDPPYYYDGKMYHFEGADGEAVYYARVSEASKEASGNIRMTGELYNADDESDKPGKFEAVAKPYKYDGKNTWSIVSMKTEYYD